MPASSPFDERQLPEYARRSGQYQAENEECLKFFEAEMRREGLGERTIRRHMGNADFYLNTYLLNRDVPCSMAEGITGLHAFFLFYYIRKCSWASPAGIRAAAASLKKFYGYMLRCGRVEQSGYDRLLGDIRQYQEMWMAACYAFKNISLKTFHKITDGDRYVPELHGDPEEDILPPEFSGLVDDMTGEELMAFIRELDVY